MLTNIIDRRKRPYRFKRVYAIIEPARHDNHVKDADKAKRNPKMDKAWLGYDDKENVSVLGAVVWAAAHKDEVTLYLYDKDCGFVTRRVWKNRSTKKQRVGGRAG